MFRRILNFLITTGFLVVYFNKRIKVDLLSIVSFRNFGNENLKGSKKYPIVVKGSSVGEIEAKEGCKIINAQVGNNVTLGKFVSINGPATRIAANKNRVYIGSYSSIASNVVIQEYYHRYNRISSYYIFQNIIKGKVDKDIYSKGDVTLEEDVWVGLNSVILSGITIGRGSVIAAGTIVTKNIPSYSIVAGNPGKVIKKRFSDEVIELLEETKWWMWDVEEIISKKNIFEIEDQEDLIKNLRKVVNEKSKNNQLLEME